MTSSAYIEYNDNHIHCNIRSREYHTEVRIAPIKAMIMAAIIGTTLLSAGLEVLVVGAIF